MKGSLKIAMVLNTGGLEYDDRIRKEILTVKRHLPDTEFKIFAIVPDNRGEKGITDYGIPYELFSLYTRKKYPSSTHLVQKAYEFYTTVKPHLKDYDVIWCADCHVFFFPLFMSKRKKIIWDLHELPKQFMGKRIMRSLFRFLESRSDLMFHANQSRIDYLKSIKMITNPNKHIPLRNYPDKTSLTIRNGETTKKFEEFRNWLGSDDCVYIQGIYEKGRRAYESMAAICSIQNLKAVVVGRVDPDAVLSLEESYGKEFIRNKFFFTGMVPQKTTKLYINACKLSIIFYSITTPNNKFCEPNRLFQTVLCGLPAVVGCNPPMKEFVEKFHVGVGLNSDGEDIKEIKDGIVKILNNYNFFKDNIEKNRELILWENQDEIITDSLRKVLGN